MNLNKPIIKDGYLRIGENSIRIGSKTWFDWLTTANKFSFKYPNGGFVAQREQRRDKSYWYAYRRRSGKLHKAYLGKREELTLERLLEINSSITNRRSTGESTENHVQVHEYQIRSRIDSSFLPVSKITVPVLPKQLVSRSRLNEKINTPLTLIHAPSGFGKSTLLNDWKQTCGFPVAWLTLDEHDNNPTRFWFSLITALKTINHGFGKELLAYLGAGTSLQPPEVIHHLTNDMIESNLEISNLGIVLDDFHKINHASIYDAIQFWLEHFPANLQVVISGHTRPPFSLGHLRSQGLLTELDVKDLRFTTAEGVSYLQQYPQDSTLAYGDLEKLVTHTEGWAAGLTLTALALGKQDDQRHFIDTFSGAHIYLREYFMETVLQRSNPKIQSFLLKTAILKNLTGSLCDAITEQTDGEEILEHLWQENLFIIRLEEHGWYRYHDLFAEMLRSQLHSRYPEEIANFHRRAAQWYREQYAPADAVYHLLSIEAWEEAATLIEEMALRELEQYGEDSRLLRWLQDLPEIVVQKHKTLLFVYIRLANNALPQKKIEKFITYIERNITSKPEILQTPDELDVLTEIQQIRHTWAQGHTYIPPTHTDDEFEYRWSLFTRLYLLTPAYAQCQDYPEEPFIELFNDAQALNNLFVIQMTGGSLAKRFVLAGQLQRAEKICRQALEKALNQRGQLPETASIPLIILGVLYYERGESELAQKYLEQSLEVDPNPTSTNMPIQIAILRAKIQMHLGQKSEALATIQTARNLHQRRPAGAWSYEDLLAQEAWIQLQSENLEAAEQLLADKPAGVEHHLLQQIQAEIFAKQGHYLEAEELLWDIIEKFPSMIVVEPLQEARVLLALVLFQQNKIHQSVQIMNGAIRLAAPEGFIRPFLKYGKECTPILLILSETQKLNSEAHHFLKRILKTVAPMAGQIDPTTMDKLSKSASVSNREQEILNLLSQGYSNREIAQKLLVSESTVKTHLANIYTKLKVNNRMQAVALAKQTKIIS
ncbi:MAG: hypothetical protein H6634_18240 [Anaerolineales bacterium]|nr:hypothetical protein [Anaerolineales bacterium]